MDTIWLIGRHAVYHWILLRANILGVVGKVPLDFLCDNKFSHYAAQQNLYAVLIQALYGVSVSSMWLV